MKLLAYNEIIVYGEMHSFVAYIMKIMITYNPTFFAIQFQENLKTDPVI